ncbi:unnamed protein product [Dimorphilus gyrociliatus]|uniref:DNA helicase MCM9 n=1 Tax=Dimorphilus gyrociliatus TaxID=2664684 RepID=A0A7I8VKS2_9ANNE|nr:unnamed protein product [Dimorphilus gyrociliatus]
MAEVMFELEDSEIPKDLLSQLEDYFRVDIKCKNGIKNILEEDDPDAHYALNIYAVDLFLACEDTLDALTDEPFVLLYACMIAIRNVEREFLEEEDSKNYVFKKNVHGRIFGLLTTSTFHREVMPKTKDVGQFFGLCGTITRTSNVKLLPLEREVKCSKCQTSFDIPLSIGNWFMQKKPKRCKNGCKSWNLSFTNQHEPDRSKSTNFQEVKMQENATSVGVPKSIEIILLDDLVDCCRPGDDVKICGILMRRTRNFQVDNRPDIDFVFLANHIEFRHPQRNSVTMTSEFGRKFTEYWKEYEENPFEGLNLLLKSVCPQIYGMYVVKLALLLVIIGGVRQERDVVHTRGQSHMLLIGDPGTGKSHLLQWATRVVQRSVRTTGIFSSGAGLTAVAVREGSEWTLEAGALVLADKGICCVDELSTMSENDRTLLHEAMEQQTVSIAKAGIVCKLNTRTSLIGATNPKHGKYDWDLSLSLNVNMSTALLSRFDVIYVLCDDLTPDWVEKKSKHIIKSKIQAHNIGLQLKKNEDEVWSVENIKAYLMYIKEEMKPDVSIPAAEVMKAYYRHVRKNSQHRGKDTGQATLRFFESLIRLAKAHAKLMMKTQVDVVDAVMAIYVIDLSICGRSIIRDGTNVVTTNIPVDAKASYLELAKTILGHLKFHSYLEEELQRWK